MICVLRRSGPGNTLPTVRYLSVEPGSDNQYRLSLILASIIMIIAIIAKIGFDYESIIVDYRTIMQSLGAGLGGVAGRRSWCRRPCSRWHPRRCSRCPRQGTCSRRHRCSTRPAGAPRTVQGCPDAAQGAAFLGRRARLRRAELRRGPASMTRAREEVVAVMPSDARFVYFPSEASIFPIGWRSRRITSPLDVLFQDLSKILAN